MPNNTPDHNHLEDDVLSSLTRSEQLRAKIAMAAKGLSQSALQIQGGTDKIPVHRVAGELYNRARHVEQDLSAL